MFHRGQVPGHTPAIFEEIPAMVCDGLRWSAMLLDASKSQQNGLFHRIVWQGLMMHYELYTNIRMGSYAYVIFCLG